MWAAVGILPWIRRWPECDWHPPMVAWISRLLPIFKSLLGVVPFVMTEIVNGVFLYINLRLAIDPVKSRLARELLDCVCTLVPDTFIQLLTLRNLLR